MEIEVEIEHRCPKCDYRWVTMETVYIEPPEHEDDY